jgi:hypothetical protein
MATKNSSVKPNKLEQSILQGAMAAQKQYIDMTDGSSLGHAPESFLQMAVAQKVAKATGNAVYVDISLQKIINEIGRGPGRPAGNARQRPDISVWYKSNATIRAVIEIESTHLSKPIAGDAKKIEKMMKLTSRPQAGYILGYSESKGKQPILQLERKFKDWAEKTKWHVFEPMLRDESGDEGEPFWAWGFISMRHP